MSLIGCLSKEERIPKALLLLLKALVKEKQNRFTLLLEETLELSSSECVDSDSFSDSFCSVNLNCFPGLLLFLMKAKDNLESSDLRSFIKSSSPGFGLTCESKCSKSVSLSLGNLNTFPVLFLSNNGTD